MILKYQDLLSQVKEIQEKIPAGSPIQKIMSSTRYVSFQLRAPGKTFFLYHGRGKGHEGLWLGDSVIPSKLRCRDRYLEYLRKKVSSGVYQSLDIAADDRIIWITFVKQGEVCRLGLFWKGRSLYFAFINETTGKIYRSWSLKEEEYGESYLVSFDSIREKKISQDQKSDRIKTITELLKDEALEVLVPESINKLKKKREKKMNAIEEDIKDLQAALSMKNNLLDNFQERKTHENKISLGRFSLKLKMVGFYQQKDELFNWFKRLSKGLSHQQLRLEKLKKGPKHDSQTTLELSANPPFWRTAKKSQHNHSKQSENQYIIIQREGFKIGVGQSAFGNDQLRKEFAKKSDTWFHLKGETSAHAIVKLETGTALTPQIIEQVGEVIARMSGIKRESFELIYCQVKDLKSVTGKPGMVTYKKEKHFLCRMENHL